MSLSRVKYLLVGGGLTSSSAAREIRCHDSDGSMLLVGQEIHRPYHRPGLSKHYLRGLKSKAELYAVEPQWFSENKVELRTGRRATHLDVARRAVTLDDGQEIGFEKLLLATGAVPAPLKVPGAQLPNVCYLRTLEDADRLRLMVEKALSEGTRHEFGRGTVAVVGGGLLAVEMAASLRQMGLAVHLLGPQSGLWDSFAGEATGRLIAQVLESKGVRVSLGHYPRRLEGDGRVQRVVLDELVVGCDFVAAAVGITVNKALLRGTPIAAERAILVNEHCQTNVEGIYAAGDCAAIFDPLFGKHRLIDHWENARYSGALAGANMAGVERRYETVSTFGSEIFGVKMSAWGESRHVQQRWIRGKLSADQPDFIEFGANADGRLAQVIAVGHGGDDEKLAELVRRRIQVGGIEERLQDATVPLEQL